MTGLWQRITSFANLCAAAKNAARGKRTAQSAARFLSRLELEALRLQRELMDGSWRPGRAVQFDIRDPKVRTITAAPFADRVVHHALIDVLEPRFDSALLPCTFACRRGFGQHRALRLAQRLTRRHGYFLKLDVAKFFPSLPHEVALGVIAELVDEPEALHLCERIVRAGGAHGCGLPIGNLTSQWFANLVLGQLDRALVEHHRAPGYVRYMDDFVLFADDKRYLRQMHREVIEWLERRGMRLKDRATILAPITQGLPFLGFRIYRGLVRLRPENARRTRARIRRRLWQHRLGLLDEDQLSDCMRATLAHLDHGNTRALRRAWFAKETAGDRFLLEPQQPRRQLQQLRPQRAVRQPQRQRTFDPQPQPGPPPREDVSTPDCAHRIAACAHRAP
jgi:RNA-directed DNA polymerase